MNSEAKARLADLHQLLSPGNDFTTFKEAFKIFRNDAASHRAPSSHLDPISAANRLKSLLPHSASNAALTQPGDGRKLDGLVDELSKSTLSPKLPEIMDFLRALTPNTSPAMAEGLWNAAGDARGSRVATPESGFAGTPQDGGNLGIFGSQLNPSATLPVFTGSRLPVPPDVMAGHLTTAGAPLPSSLGAKRVTELQLVRDLMCVVLGFDGALVKLTVDACRMTSANVEVDSEFRQLALKIGYTGWIFRELRRFCETKIRDLGSGLCSQRVCELVMQEMQQFRRNVALLDAKVHRDDPQHTYTDDLCRPDQLSLRKFHYAIEDDQYRLDALLNMVSSTNKLKGGELVTALYKLSLHGNPHIHLLGSKLTHAAVQPLLLKIRQWIFFGLLDDPHNEFFLVEDSDTAPEAYWTSRFQLRESMIPYFLSPDEARQIFAGGKSTAFIKAPKETGGRAPDRLRSNDRIPGMEAFSSLADCAFDGADPIWDSERNRIKLTCLEKLLAASGLASLAVVNMLREEYHLGCHFSALQKFFLLGLGDFILCLIDSLIPYLNQPATTLPFKNLRAILEVCVSSTDAKWEHPHVLQALDTIVLALPSGKVEIGWDAFLLEYRLKKQSAVLSIVLTTSIVTRYKQIFAFLWRVKRAEFILFSAWKETMCDRLENWKIPGFELLCHEAGLLLYRMLDFLQQIQSSYNVDVLDVGWTAFCDKLTTAKSLDEIISYQDEFLGHVEEKCFIKSKTNKNCRDLGLHLRAVLLLTVKLEACFVAIQDAARRELTNLAGLAEPDLESHFYLDELPSLFTSIQMLESNFKSEVIRFKSLMDKMETDEPTSNSSLRSGLDFNCHYRETGKKVRNQETLNAAGFDDSPSSAIV